MARLGRVGYSHRAPPAIQVVSHVIDLGDIVFRCHGRPPVIPPGQGGPGVLAYEADDVDPDRFTGWRVTVTGVAKLVRRPQEVARLNGCYRLGRWVGTGAGWCGCIQGYEQVPVSGAREARSAL